MLFQLNDVFHISYSQDAFVHHIQNSPKKKSIEQLLESRQDIFFLNISYNGQEYPNSSL